MKFSWPCPVAGGGITRVSPLMASELFINYVSLEKSFHTLVQTKERQLKRQERRCGERPASRSPRIAYSVSTSRFWVGHVRLHAEGQRRGRRAGEQLPALPRNGARDELLSPRRRR